jgi:hypothetical protein
VFDVDSSFDEIEGAVILPARRKRENIRGFSSEVLFFEIKAFHD